MQASTVIRHPSTAIRHPSSVNTAEQPVY